MASVLDSYLKQSLGSAYKSRDDDKLDSYLKQALRTTERTSRKKKSTAGATDTSLLSRAAKAPIAGLAAIGNVLDIPGSVVRDTLGGDNPLDQLLPWNWTSHEGRLSGRDLLRKYDLAGNKDTWANWGAGLVAEIGLDPLTYVTLGGSALSKAGKTAKAAGILDDVAKISAAGPRVGRMTSTLEDLVTGAKGLYGPDEFTEGAASNISKRRALERVAKEQKFNLDDIYGTMPLGGLAAPIGPLAGLAGDAGVWGKAGGMAERVAGGMDIAGKTVAESRPGVFMRGLFDSKVRGTFTKAEQRLAESVTTAQQQARPAGRMAGFEMGDVIEPALRQFEEVAGDEIMQAAQRRVVGPAAEAAAQAIKSPPVDPRAASKLHTKAMEDVDKAMSAFQAIDKATEIRRVANAVARHASERDIAEALDIFDIKNVSPAHPASQGIEAAVRKAQQVNKAKIEQINEMGGGVHLLDDEQIQHIGRYADVSKASYRDKGNIESALMREATMRGVPVNKLPADVTKRVTDEATQRGGSRIANTKTAVDFARTQETRTVPAAIVNELLVDPAIRAGKGADGQVLAAQHILDTYQQYLDPKYVGRSKPSAAANLAKWVEKNNGRPGFTEMLHKQTELLNTPDARNAIEQHAWELAQHIRVHARRPRYTHEVMQDQLRYTEAAYRKEGMLKAIHEYVRKSATDAAGIPINRVFQDAGMDSGKAVEFFAKQGGLTAEQASHLNVPQDVAAAVKSVIASSPGSVWGNEVGRALDWVNDFMRGTLTLPFPAFHVRNLSSGQYINLSTGAIQNSADLTAYKAAMQQAKALRANPNDPQWREIKAHNVFGTGSGQRMERGFDDTPSVAAELPEFMDKPLLRTVGSGYQKVMEKGSQAMNWVEYYNRVPLYLYYRKKGFEPLQAAMEVKKRHFDYSELTDFERNFLRRGFLFYSFTRKMAPLMAETLMERPGGAMAQVVKQTGHAQARQEQPVPEWITQTTSIPLSPTASGDLRFVTGLGLPQEDVASFYGSPIEELLSRTSPVLKAPLEMAFDRSLFQRGRPLDELDPSLGRVIGNVKELAGGAPVADTRAKPFLGNAFEFALANSPASRVLSSLRTATDPRKSVLDKTANLFTGGRVTHVSPAVQDAVLRENAAAIMKRLGGKTFTKTYIPAEERAKMTTAQIQLADQLDGLMTELANRRKQRTQEKAKR